MAMDQGDGLKAVAYCLGGTEGALLNVLELAAMRSLLGRRDDVLAGDRSSQKHTGGAEKLTTAQVRRPIGNFRALNIRRPLDQHGLRALLTVDTRRRRKYSGRACR
jgi:hypothetical protein